MPAISYLARLHSALGKLGQGNGSAPPQDTSNSNSEVSTCLAQAFLWKETEKYAKAKYDAALKSLLGNYDVPAPSGEYVIRESQHFQLSLKVSEPVNSFDANEFANIMSKGKYRVPSAYTKEMLAKAKTPGNSRHTYKIVEI